MNRLLAFTLLVLFSIPGQSLSVSDQRLADAASEPGNWMSHGKTWREQRFSPLKEIHDSNVDQLGISWFFETPFTNGLQGTPLVVLMTNSRTF